MRSILLSGFLVLAVLTSPGAASELSLHDWNASRLGTEETAMLVLGSWAVLNLGVSGVGMATSTGRTFSFHELNVLWNALNLAIAGYGYFSLRAEKPGSLSLGQSLDELRLTERIVWLNIGLDAAYLAVAFWLRAKSDLRAASGDTTGAARYGGFGDALLVQGGFLLAFDVVLAVLLGGKGSPLAASPSAMALRF